MRGRDLETRRMVAPRECSTIGVDELGPWVLAGGGAGGVDQSGAAAGGSCAKFFHGRFSGIHRHGADQR